MRRNVYVSKMELLKNKKKDSKNLKQKKLTFN